MGRRRLGRETAFKALYRIDLLGLGFEEAVAGLPEGDRADPESVRFAQELLESMAAHRTEIDAALSAACTTWGLDRLAPVDRSLLRLGCAEILHWEWIPGEVSIDEYVDIAKKYGSEQSSGFVNAVLDRIARERAENGGGT